MNFLRTFLIRYILTLTRYITTRIVCDSKIPLVWPCYAGITLSFKLFFIIYDKWTSTSSHTFYTTMVHKDASQLSFRVREVASVRTVDSGNMILVKTVLLASFLLLLLLLLLLFLIDMLWCNFDFFINFIVYFTTFFRNKNCYLLNLLIEIS